MELDPKSFIVAGIATKYTTVSAMTFLSLEHLLTLEAEVCNACSEEPRLEQAVVFRESIIHICEDIRKMKSNRYFGVVALMINTVVLFNASVTDQIELMPLPHILIVISSCARFFWWQGVSFVRFFRERISITEEAILMSRIYAVYGRNKKLLLTLIVLCIIEVMGTVLLVNLGMLNGIARPFKGTTGCYATGRVTFICWIPFLTFESLLCFLMLRKAWIMHKERCNAPLLTLLIRDSVLYFLTIFAILLVNTLMWAVAPPAVAEVAYGWGIALPCAVGTRLLLNMRERCCTGDTTLASDWISFAQVPIHFQQDVSDCETPTEHTVNV
ncbi:hypothetical protein K439DRAFT_1664978 [Ramaria rubella]|nr:hypothetical protein K439DRAFT_1664978 [Ramaria rubella]